MGVYGLFIVAVLAMVAIHGVAAGELSCDTCTGVFVAAETLLPQNATVREVVRVWDTVCGVLGNSTKAGKDCLKIGEKIGEVLPRLPDFINHDPYSPRVLCAILSFCSVPCCSSETLPEQVHVGTGLSVDDVYVSFAAASSAKASDWAVEIDGRKVMAVHSTYTSGGWDGQLFTAHVTGLSAGATHHFRVGSASLGAYSPTFALRTMENNASAVTMAVVGDMGAEKYSDPTRASLLRLAPGGIDMMLHNGDTSYADGDQVLWDQYLRLMQPILTQVPTMYVPGNHEIPFNFTAYRHRFPNPTWSSGMGNAVMFHSYDAGPVHVVGVDTEGELDTALVTDAQLAWLRKDLAAANARRSDTPWIVVMGHRPLYCSNKDSMNCEVFSSYLVHRLEAAYNEFGVDLVFQAHQHDYERSYPMRAGKPVSTSYRAPSAPVYVLNGAAGNREGIRSFPEPQPSWVASHISELSYGILTANRTTLAYKQLMSGSDELLDSFVISK